MVTLPIALGATVFGFQFDDNKTSVVRYKLESAKEIFLDTDNARRIDVGFNSLEEEIPNVVSALIAFDGDRLLLKCGFFYKHEVLADAQKARWEAENYSF